MLETALGVAHIYILAWGQLVNVVQKEFHVGAFRYVVVPPFHRGVDKKWGTAVWGVEHWKWFIDIDLQGHLKFVSETSVEYTH